MAWTPSDLKYRDFVEKKLSPSDRSNALFTMENNITSAASALERNRIALAEIQEQTNNQYSFGTVRDARRTAQTAGGQND